MARSFPESIEGMTQEDAAREYRKLLESRNSIKKYNDDLSKYLCKLDQAVTILATEGSLAFQAMAEKAEVRAHPSVSKVVELFESIAFNRTKAMDSVAEWPKDWSFDRDHDVWSGDAEMLLSKPIDDAIEFMERELFQSRMNDKKREEGNEIISALHRAVEDIRTDIKKASFFTPKEITIPEGNIHEMSIEELRSVISAMSWLALDLAQDMDFSNKLLRRDLRASGWRRIAADLYRLSQLSFEHDETSNIDIKVFGTDIPF